MCTCAYEGDKCVVLSDIDWFQVPSSTIFVTNFSVWVHMLWNYARYTVKEQCRTLVACFRFHDLLLPKQYCMHALEKCILWKGCPSFSEFTANLFRIQLRWRASNVTQPCNNLRRGFRFTALERPSRSCVEAIHGVMPPVLFQGFSWASINNVASWALRYTCFVPLRCPQQILVKYHAIFLYASKISWTTLAGTVFRYSSSTSYSRGLRRRMMSDKPSHQGSSFSTARKR